MPCCHRPAPARRPREEEEHLYLVEEAEAVEHLPLEEEEEVPEVSQAVAAKKAALAVATWAEAWLRARRGREVPRAPAQPQMSAAQVLLSEIVSLHVV